MPDQAQALRRLVTEGVAAPPPDAPRLVVVAGAKGGAGATTLGVNLAVALAQQGCAAVLVDADPDGGHVATLCSLADRATIADVLAGRRTVEDSLIAGPCQIPVLAGAWAASLADTRPASLERLVSQLGSLTAQVVVIDAGSGLGRWQRTFWQAADLVLLVTTSEVTSVMDAYAAIKVLACDPPAPVSLVVSKADASAADAVHARLQAACRRFLGMTLDLAGCVPADNRMADAVVSGQPLVLRPGESPAARSIHVLAHNLAGRLQLRHAGGSLRRTHIHPSHSGDSREIAKSVNLRAAAGR
jgi:flagellar biosynthesis protein FlhG